MRWTDGTVNGQSHTNDLRKQWRPCEGRRGWSTPDLLRPRLKPRDVQYAVGRYADMQWALALIAHFRQGFFLTPICVVPPSHSLLKLCAFERLHSSSSWGLTVLHWVSLPKVPPTLSLSSP